MKKTLYFVFLLLFSSMIPISYGEEIPQWIKNNAGWWADGSIDDNSFVQGIQFLIKENILVVPISQTTESSGVIPDWIKNNAGWWVEGITTDEEFISAIQHLMKIGIINVSLPESNLDDSDSVLSALQKELESCKEITKAYERLDCEKAIKTKINVYFYKTNSEIHQVGPITFYYPGIGTEGNALSISDSGQAILSIRMLAENSDSSENISMMCTGPSICNYDVWDGSKSYKYSGMDFTNGQIVLKPGESRIFNMLFGPNIGYGGTAFEYDSTKDYYFRISEPWGSTQFSLNLR